MGVTYKLTENIVQFILKQKQGQPNSSCRELVDLVYDQYQVIVSKSSVHDILKEANITSPRGRKFKNKFQIPAAKKAQLIASLPAALPMIVPTITPVQPKEQVPPSILLPQPIENNYLIEQESIFVPETLKPLEQSALQDNMGDIFLKAAFWDLFPSPWRGVKTYQELETIDAAQLCKEFEYRSITPGPVKVELEDGNALFIDTRFQNIDGDLHLLTPRGAPIERVVNDMADFILNNIKPLIIKEFKNDVLNAHFYDLLAAFEGKDGKKISKISITSFKGDALAEFGNILAFHREFIIGIQTQVIEIKQFIENNKKINITPSYFYADPLKYLKGNIALGGNQYRVYVFLGPDNVPIKAILTNISPSIDDNAIVRAYAQRHPLDHSQIDALLPSLPAQKTTFELLKAHIRPCFGKALSQDQWKTINSLKALIKQNTEVFIVNLFIPDGCENKKEILQAISNINSWNITDDTGRQIKLDAR